MNKNTKKIISNCALGAAIVAAPTAALTGISKATTSEFWMYIYMGTFLLSAFLHWFFWEETFDNIETINYVLMILFTWLPFLFLYAFMLGDYVAMFISLGFFIMTYLIYLLVDILKLEKRNAD